jgi:hypothetical protein
VILMVDQEIKDVLVNAGMDLRNKMIEKINSNIPPANAPSTVKKSSKTLVDNGTLLNSIDTQVVSESENSIEIATGVFDEGVAQYAIANEFGSVRTVTTKNKDNEGEQHQGYSIIVIPERSFMRSSYDQNIDEIMNNVSDEIGAIMASKFKNI